MRAIARRLRRLEERIGPAPETWESKQMEARLEAARRRVGFPAAFLRAISRVAGQEHR
jgi:hypothetical protein